MVSVGSVSIVHAGDMQKLYPPTDFLCDMNLKSLPVISEDVV